MMNHHYAEAIDILLNQTVDYKVMCIELAKQNPELFCNLAVKATPRRDTAWHKDAIAHMRADQIVSAIKLCREKTGFGLKEAKDVIDALRDRDRDPWFNPAHLLDQQLAVYRDMIRSI